MAVLRCLVHHKGRLIEHETDASSGHASPAPKRTVQAHDLTVYARPARDLRCGIDGCREDAVVWLDQEELRDYERGARIFWEAVTYARVRVDDRPLRSVDPAVTLPEVPAAFWWVWSGSLSARSGFIWSRPESLWSRPGSRSHKGRSRPR